MWQKFMSLSLTPITLHPTCQLQCVGSWWKNYLWQWPEASLELCSWAPAIRRARTCAGIRVYIEVGKSEGLCGGLYPLFLVEVKIHCACLFCAAAVRLSTAWRHSGPPRSAPLLSPWLSGREVLMAAAMLDSLSICYGWHSSFTVTSPRLTVLARAPCCFSFSLQTCTWLMVFFYFFSMSW